MAVITSDVLAAITRADKRWASQHNDDPAPANYLAALAAAADSAADRDLTAGAQTADELERATRILAQRDTDIAKLRDTTGQQATGIDRLRGVIRTRDDSINALKETVQDQKMTAALTNRHLRRVVEAITGQPATEITEPVVDRAVQLVTAAVDQLGQRMDAGAHVHQYPQSERGAPIEPCSCGKPYPREARHA